MKKEGYEGEKSGRKANKPGSVCRISIAGHY